MNNENRKKLSDVLFIIAFVCVIIVGVLFVRNRIQDNHSEEIMDELREQASAASPSPTAPPSASPTQAPAASPTQSPAATPVPTPEAVVNPYREAFLSNEDMGAWLQIPGTDIDYPVMWTPEDEEYYLYRGFDGSENKNGSLILDTDSCLNPLTTNLIIHGHNMKSGAMFGCLTDYEDESYYQEHKDIILYTEEC